MPKLTIAQAAERLNLTRQRVHILARDGRLGQVTKVGPIRLVSQAAVERFAALERGTGRPKPKH